jgi:hypothetical protein
MSSLFSSSRRNFLRGFGTLIALPALEAFTPVAKAISGAATPGMAGGKPLRMAFIYSPNGKNMTHWRPQNDGAAYGITRALKPLEKLKADFQVISGLSHDKARANGDGGGDHARANATFLTGCQARKTSGADIKVGVSVDQLAADQIGHLTKLPSMELSCDEVRRAGNCDSGYSCSYQFNLAWKSESTPLSPERDPRLAFERLFGAENSSDAAQAKAKRDYFNKSILDFVQEDTKALQKHLGYTDQQKLDEYLTSVREIERRMTSGDKFKASKRPEYKVPSGIPSSYKEHIRLMYDLMWLAFQTDSTRIATFMLAHDGSNRSFPEIGVPDAHHGISHHQRNPDRLEKLAKIDEFYSEQFAYFLDKLKSTKEGNGTLLDNSLIVFGGGISDPDRHNHDDLPVLLAGGGGGALRKGRHLKLKEDVPMTNMYLKMLEIMGVEAKHLGDSTGTLGLI